MKNAIDLNQNQDPEMMDMAASPSQGVNAKPHYPEITLHHGSKPKKMPKSGHAKVKYSVVEHKAVKSKKSGKMHHSTRVKLHNFAPMGGAGMQLPSDEEGLESAMQEQGEQAQGGGDDAMGN